MDLPRHCSAMSALPQDGPPGTRHLSDSVSFEIEPVYFTMIRSSASLNCGTQDPYAPRNRIPESLKTQICECNPASCFRPFDTLSNIGWSWVIGIAIIGTPLARRSKVLFMPACVVIRASIRRIASKANPDSQTEYRQYGWLLLRRRETRRPARDG